MLPSSQELRLLISFDEVLLLGPVFVGLFGVTWLYVVLEISRAQGNLLLRRLSRPTFRTHVLYYCQLNSNDHYVRRVDP